MDGNLSLAYQLHGRPIAGSLLHYYVYAIFFRDGFEDRGYVKIGFTMRPHGRLHQIKTSCPMQAKMMALMEIGPNQKKARRVERDLHRELSGKRAKRKGEWFKIDYNSSADRQELGDASKKVFRKHLGPDHDWWQEINVEAMEDAERKRRAAFMRAKRESFKKDKWERIRAYKARMAEFEHAKKMVDLEDKIFGKEVDEDMMQVRVRAVERLAKEIEQMEEPDYS